MPAPRLNDGMHRNFRLAPLAALKYLAVQGGRAGPGVRKSPVGVCAPAGLMIVCCGLFLDHDFLGAGGAVGEYGDADVDALARAAQAGAAQVVPLHFAHVGVVGDAVDAGG